MSKGIFCYYDSYVQWWGGIWSTVELLEEKYGVPKNELEELVNDVFEMTKFYFKYQGGIDAARFILEERGEIKKHEEE